MIQCAMIVTYVFTVNVEIICNILYNIFQCYAHSVTLGRPGVILNMFRNKTFKKKKKKKKKKSKNIVINSLSSKY